MTGAWPTTIAHTADLKQENVDSLKAASNTAAPHASPSLIPDAPVIHPDTHTTTMDKGLMPGPDMPEAGGLFQRQVTSATLPKPLSMNMRVGPSDELMSGKGRVVDTFDTSLLAALLLEHDEPPVVEVNLMFAGSRQLYTWDDPERAAQFVRAWEKAPLQVEVSRLASNGTWTVRLSKRGDLLLSLPTASREEAVWLAAHLSMVQSSA